MKNLYDKLILLVAVVALVGGVMLYLNQSGEAPDSAAPVDVRPADNPYAPVPIPETPTNEASWPEPTEQSTNWVYDVFTPPKIYINEAGQFTEVRWEPPEPPEPFGLYLAEITRDLYRIQIQGYIEEDRNDPSKTLVLLNDEERDTTVRLREGETNQASEVEVIDFEIDREINAEEGRVELTARATIRDLRTGETIVLIKDETLYESGVEVTLRSEQQPDFEIQLSEPGATFENDLGKYKLLKINLENQSVIVEKLPSEADSESEVEELTLDSAKPTKTPSASTNRPNSPPTNQESPASVDLPF